MKKALIIGGGMAGCAMAHQLSLAGGWDTTLLEQGRELGAGVRTQWLGGHPYTFGPRHFLTRNERVYEFLNEYVPLRRCNEHEFLTYVEQDRDFYSYPIHVDDIELMPEKDRIRAELQDAPANGFVPTNFEEFWTYAVGPTLYGKFIDSYSKKMWNVTSNKKIDTFTWSPKGTTLKHGPRQAWDTALSAYPQAKNGYDDYFKIAAEGVRVLLGTNTDGLDIGLRRLWKDDAWHHFDIVVSTIAPDTLFHNCFGRLAFMGRDLVTLVLPVEFALPENVYFCYYAGKEPYTRVTEYKKFTKHEDPSSTLITIETPSQRGRLYPMPFKSEKTRAQRYFDLLPQDVYSIGRAGSYDYAIDIDDCIAQAMEIRERLR